MRLGLYNRGCLGLLVDDFVVDVSAVVDAVGPGGRLDALIRSDACSAIDRTYLSAAPRTPLADVVWEAPLPRPGKIIGAPANYYEHIAEMMASKSIAEWGFFLKAPTSVIGPRETIQLPYIDVRTDYEGELAVIIGRRGRNISVDDAMRYVFGYSCVLDVTVRSTEDRSTRKSFDTFTPLGPIVVTAEEIEDVANLELRLDINGAERQRCSTGKMIYRVPELIAYISSVMTIEPGDVIATGTPGGVGPLHDGDIVTLSVANVGTLRVSVSDRTAIKYGNRPGPAQVASGGGRDR
jgi:2-keto-4-pentenoate hydratase/2-oxohepta-3-ene-1,7-dioic acid hydratase in catechol pathway